MIYASRRQNESQFIVQTINAEHSYARHYANDHVTISWIVHYIYEFKDRNKGAAATVKRKVFSDFFFFNVSEYKCYRARDKAHKIIEGSVCAVFKALDYGEELRRRNVSSTVILKVVNGSMEMGQP